MSSSHMFHVASFFSKTADFWQLICNGITATQDLSKKLKYSGAIIIHGWLGQKIPLKANPAEAGVSTHKK
jgi:hypothetical protein